MDWKLEVVILPVSDVDRAKAFYVDQLGFNLDVDHQPNEHFRVVQLTPPGSACSVTIGVGLTSSEPGTVHGTHLIVSDIETAAAHLAERGVAFEGPYWFGENGPTPGVHPNRGKYESFCNFADPDGNTWTVQECNRNDGS
jgi:catechol 2,3-dioxygenase-like lactoylglutathione lyase family enzyme